MRDNLQRFQYNFPGEAAAEPRKTAFGHQVGIYAQANNRDQASGFSRLLLTLEA